jgi:hypothetical protein
MRLRVVDARTVFVKWMKAEVERKLQSEELETNQEDRGTVREDGCLLGCSAVLTGISLPTLQRYLLLPSLHALTMEAVRTTETLADSYQTIRRHNTGGSSLRTDRRVVLALLLHPTL